MLYFISHTDVIIGCDDIFDSPGRTMIKCGRNSYRMKLTSYRPPAAPVRGRIEAMVITRGGIIPGGLLAEAMNLVHILTAAVDFPAQMEMERVGLLAWPRYLQFLRKTCCVIAKP
jgi:hypothetical protein